MTQIFDCRDPQQRAAGLDEAQQRLTDGQLVVVPTDTVYGLAADAFSLGGVDAIFDAKGRGREMPPPVLVPDARTVDGLAMSVPHYARKLIDAFWPGGLTLVLRAQQSLTWDLGDTNGTVGLRMPDDEVALELLTRTGPLAVSSANRTGKPAATTVTEAGFMLGPFVETYLDDSTRADNRPSTIIDCTRPEPVVLREGAVTVPQLQDVLGDLHLVLPGDEPGAGATPAPEPAEAEDEPSGAGATPWGDEPSTDEPAGAGPDHGPATSGEPPADSAGQGSLGGHWDEDDEVSPSDVRSSAEAEANWSYGDDVPVLDQDRPRSARRRAERLRAEQEDAGRTDQPPTDW